ncbi:MAG: hypothetical protein IJZ10_01490 [Thermoguttaceae bacterium]|nr:hypothetical protein [Thermoguttaceae bacterium]
MKPSDVIVDEIRRVLDDPEGTTHEQLTELSQEFARNCRRLEEFNATVCASLDLGALCEAARIAQNEKLLDEYQALNFDQLEDWRDACRALGLAVSPPLSSANAARIAEFLIDYEKFESLFAAHRRLALAGGDAYSRLEILRKLQTAFPSYPVWETQIRSLETLREKELQKLFLNAPPQNDTLAFWLDRLAELESPERLAPCSSSFLNALRSETLRIKREKALQGATEVAKNWQNAVASNDQANILHYETAWEEATSECRRLGVTLPANLLADVRQPQEAAEYLRRHNEAVAEYERKFRRLNDLLERDASVEAISDAFEAVELAADAAGLNVPAAIAEECGGRVAASELQKRRKLTICVVAAVLFCALLAAAFFYIAQQSRLKRDAQAAADALQTHLDRFEGSAGQKPIHSALAEAENAFETYRSQSPQFLEQPEFKKQSDRLETLRRLEADRLQRFKSDVATLEESHRDNISRPDVLKRLKETYLSPDEETRYLDLKKRDDEIRRAELKTNDAAYQTGLNELVARKNALEKDQTLDAKARAAEIASIAADLKAFDAKFSGRVISQPLRDSRATFETVVKKLSEDAQLNVELDNLSGRLQNAVGDAAEFEAQLTRFRGKISDESIDQALQSLAIVSHLDRWNAFVQNYPNSDAWRDDNASFVQIETSLTPVFTSLPKFLPEFGDVRSRLRTIRGDAIGGAAVMGRKELAQELKRVFEFCAPELYLYAKPGGSYYYYLTSQPKNVSNKPPVDYCVDVTNGKPKVETFNLSLVKAEEYDDIQIALQYEIYQKIQALPETPSEQEWFDVVVDILEQIIRADETRLDPAVKIVLLKRLTTVIYRDPYFGVFAEWRADLAGVDDQLNLYRATRSLNNLRAEAKKTLAKLAEKAESKKPNAQHAAEPYLDLARQSFENRAFAPLPVCRWVGFLDVVDSTALLAAPKNATLEDGTLYVASFTDGGAQAQVCGKTQNGRASINPGFIAKRWNLVFLCPDASAR